MSTELFTIERVDSNGNRVPMYPRTSSDQISDFEQSVKNVVGGTISDASTSDAGISKLYNSLGNNTDGSVTQALIKTELDKKLDSSSYTQATTTVAGKMKLYTTTGTATDGTITQKAITDALSGKLDSTATASKATQLENSQTVRVNLASTDTATFNGTAGITPGVTGTLDVANGGTGVTSIANIKAGKDSAGNVISDTYVTKTNSISSFSTSGTTVTFKNSAGTTLGTFTTQDSHYTSKLVVGGSSATVSAATTNGNTYVRLFDNTTVRNSYKVAGSGATTVTSDSSGNITIASTNTTYSQANASTLGLVKLYTGTGTNTDGTMTQSAIKTALDSKLNASAYTQFTGATSSTAGVGGYVPGASAGQENYVLYGNGSWGPLPNQTITSDSYIGIHLKAYNSRFSEIVAATSVVGTSGAGPRIGVKLKSNSGYSEILPATTQNTISVYVKNTSGTYDKL